MVDSKHKSHPRSSLKQTSQSMTRPPRMDDSPQPRLSFANTEMVGKPRPRTGLRTDAASVGEVTASTMSVSESSLSSRRSLISFGSVDVHTHKITLGDNPSVKRGPPVRLGSFQMSESFNLDEFEAMSKGRPKRVNRIPDHLRETWLRENGHSKESLLQISKEIEQIKTTRDMSKMDLNRMQEYQVMSNVSLRQQRRAATTAAKAEAEKKKKKGRSNSLFSRLSRKESTKSPSRRKSSSN